MELEISEEERDELATVIEKALSETRVEVRRTKSIEWRGELRHEEELLGALLERLTLLHA